MAELPAIRTICSTTPSTTGPGRRGEWRPSGSPGTRRTLSVTSSSSSRRRSARSSARRTALHRGRVGEGGLRRVRSAVRRGDRGQRGSARQPEPINEDPYGEGWLVKVRLTDASEREALIDRAPTPRASASAEPPAPPLSDMSRYTATTDDDRREMLAAIGVASIEELFDSIPGRACASTGRSSCRGGRSEQEVFAHLRDLAAANVRPRTSLRSSARACTTTTCRR